MSQLFHPSINLIVRIALLMILLLVVGLGGLGYYAATSPYFTEVGVAKVQPIPFSHKQHVGGLGLDCRYCHTSVEQAATAGMPSTATCMGCHANLPSAAPSLTLLLTSAEASRPLVWTRVHNLADYTYFNHAIHVKQGVGCETCHGRIDQMPTVVKTETLQMDWCLDCHRDPAQYLRPRDAVFTMDWEPMTNQTALGQTVLDQQRIAKHSVQINDLTDCSVCHR